MSIRVELYGPLRERAGVGTWEVTLPEGSTVADVVAAVRAQFPRLEGAEIVVAAGLDYVEPTHVPAAGEVISLTPAEG